MLSLRNKKSNVIVCLLLSLLASIDLQTFFSNVRAWDALTLAFNVPFSTYILTFVFLILIFRQKVNLSNKLYQWVSAIFSFIFSFYLTIGQIYLHHSEFYSTHNTSEYFVFLIVKVATISYITYRLVTLIFSKGKATYFRSHVTRKNSRNFNYLKSELILLLCWLPYVVILFPASSNPDTSNQIVEFFGKGASVRDVYPIGHYLLTSHPFSISNQHNFLVTFFYGSCVKAGLYLFHNVNSGLFIAAIIQVIALSIVLTYSVKTFYEIGINPVKISVIKWIYRLFPLFPIFGMFLVKNVIYSTFLVWYLCLILQFVSKPQLAKKHSWQIFLALSIFGQLISQKYAFPVILVSGICLLIAYRRSFKQLFLVFLIPLLIFRVCITGLLFNALQVPNGDPIEGQGIMLQQSALYVKKYRKTLTHKEYSTLNKVFVVRRMGALYTPEESDSIKSSGAVVGKKTVYRYKTVNAKDMKQYHKVWAEMAFKHPATYTEAALHLGYRYLDINSPANPTNYAIPSDSLPLCPTAMFMNLGSQPHQIMKLLPVRKAIASIFNHLRGIPPFGLLFQGSSYIWLTILLLSFGLYLSKQNIGKVVAMGMNLLLQVPIFMMSPIDNNSRYFLPFIFSVGIILILPDIFQTVDKSKKNV